MNGTIDRNSGCGSASVWRVRMAAEVHPLEVGVDRVGGPPAVGDRLDDGRRAGADVAGAEDAGPARLERDGVGLQAVLLGGLGPLVAGADPRQVGPLADRQQDAVALDGELRARRPAPGGAGPTRPARRAASG